MPDVIKHLARGLVAAHCLLAATFAQAAGLFPDRPITIVVPTPPGGPIDRVARAVGQQLQSELGQAVVIDNRVGASGKIGVQSALRAPRDGYTLIAVSPSIASVNPAVDKAVGYDPLKDFEPLGIVAKNSGVVAARATLPVASMRELVAYARARPDHLTYGSFGIGTSLHLHSEELASALGISLRHIPYKGESQALNALIAGEVDLMLYVTSPVVPFAEGGRVRALAATSTRRWASLPHVPSFAESGVPELQAYTYQSWVGFVLPAGVPPDVAERLGQALRAAVAKPELRRQLETQGFEVVDGRAADMKQVIATELARNRGLVASGRVRLD
ncbi:MAG: tripartite tricarboxylate transporter substrate binding protein [Burkholderiales bacterium]|nr:tripartite tricarboxylate transporter substrate binding protein [Burkholderiales bacterium]